MIGTKLAHYEITGHLGSGGMGDVYQAMDSKLGRNVAIKFIPEAFIHDAERVARFEREARVLGSLNHPNCLPTHQVPRIRARPSRQTDAGSHTTPASPTLLKYMWNRFHKEVRSDTRFLKERATTRLGHETGKSFSITNRQLAKCSPSLLDAALFLQGNSKCSFPGSVVPRRHYPRIRCNAGWQIPGCVARGT